MTYSNKVFLQFAKIFCYPEVGIAAHAESLLEELNGQKEDADHLRPFCDFVKNARHSDLEELFTRTFDMNPTCCLEIGWHLFGEDYRRGEFLVQMRQSLAEEKLPESGELPDHISHCLQLLTRLEIEDAREFTKSYLLPAMEKIRAGFKENEKSPYRAVMDLLLSVLKRNYDIKDLHHPALKVLNNGPNIETNHKGNNTFMV